MLQVLPNSSTGVTMTSTTLDRHNDEIRRYYEHSARVYRWFASVYDLAAAPLGRERQRVVDAVSPAPTAAVLDVATGTGSQAAAFAERCREVVGLDLSDAMLRVARAKHPAPNLRFVRGDATALPFADATFDVTSISFALHEMPRVVREAALRELVRVTRPRGSVVVADYGLARNRLLRGVAHHFVRLYEGELYEDFVRSDLASALHEAGCVVRRETSALGGIVRIVVATRR